MTKEELKQIRERCDAATPGPWQWFGNVKNREVDLATVDRGRVFVMQFHRWGFSGAQPRFQVRLDGEPGSGIMQGLDELGPTLGPKMLGSHRNDFIGIGHPDAVFLAASRADVPALLAEVDRLTACLVAANANHEHFERRWYLATDEIEQLRTELAAVRECLAYACDALDTEGLDETAERLRKQGGARKL